MALFVADDVVVASAADDVVVLVAKCCKRRRRKQKIPWDRNGCFLLTFEDATHYPLVFL